MGKRVNGEGTITTRADGRVMFRWTDQDGKRRTGYAKTTAEAASALLVARQRVEEEAPAVETRDTFQAVAETWARTAVTRQGITAGTLKTYVSGLTNQVYPVIGDRRLRDIKPTHVAELLMGMEAKGLSADYRANCIKAISNIFQMAISDGMVRTNPTRSVKTPTAAPADKVVPTREQVAAMIAAAPDPRARILLVTLAHTGLRISEALALRWSDWDGGDTMRVMSTKGGKPRAVPVTKTYAEELKTWKRVQAEERLASVWWGDADILISTSIGTRWDSGNARKNAFRPVANGDPENGVAGICPGATPHSMRHAAATILLEQGVPMKVVSELLGHASTRTTSETYSHVTARLIAQAGTALESALG